MFEVVLSICLIANAKVCQTHRLTFAKQDHAPLTPMTCFRDGQVEIAKFMDAKPKWRIKGWSCGAVRPGPQDI